jgi:predicted Co/Zn/Cd cation transporter (cation efflux family)
MNQKQVERQSLKISAVINFIMATAGIVVFIITMMQSMFLDGFFSLLAALSNLLAILFASMSKKKNAAYPTGMFFLEPFYGLIKAILMFVLLAVSTYESAMSAIEYWVNGTGNLINVWIILPYTVVMVAMCFWLSSYNKKQNKKINNASIMLTAESKSNFVDGVISGGIGFLVLILLFININGPLGFLHYTGDFFITMALVAIFIKEPIKLFAETIRELSGATVKNKEIKNLVRKIVLEQLQEEDLDNKFEVYKVGMHIKVVILLNEEFDGEVFSRLKVETIKEIKEHFDSVTLEYVIRKNF